MIGARAVRPYSAPLHDTADGIRYGVFLRPSAELVGDALAAYGVVQKQFGLHAAAAYPPHITLVGNFAIDARERELVAALDRVLAGHDALPMHSAGLGVAFETSLAYGVHHLADGSPNAKLVGLVAELFDAIEPMRIFPVTDRRVAVRRAESAESFRAHLTVLGHDGADHPELAPEVLEVLTALGIDGSGDWTGDRVHLFRFHSEDWGDRYWETMTWTLVKSWQLR